MNKERLGFIFDFDGTLADSLGQATEVLRDLSQRHGYKCPPIDELRRSSSREALKQIGVGFWGLPLFVYRARRALADRMHTVSLFEGTQEVLRELKQTKDCFTALLTSNSANNVHPFLKRHGLHDCFDVICPGISAFGKSKVLRKLLRTSQLSPQQMFLIGDETRDIEAARKAGVKSIAVSWGYQDKSILTQHSPDHLIESPQELLAILSSSKA